MEECKMLRAIILSLSLVLITATASYAAGAHGDLECTGCHNIHKAQGPIIFEVAPAVNAMPKDSVNPKGSIAALCLGCHGDPEKGGMGIMEIMAHTSHPYGKRVNKKVANVPDGLLRDGVMDCVSCHDPHPSNPNYKYLRVDTKKGGMREFCIVCHPAKGDQKLNRSALQLFDSMDEVSGAKSTPIGGAAPAVPAPVKK
jgi:predicted CXXCH cytochrome family protein